MVLAASAGWFCTAPAQAEALLVGAAAGYKKPVEALCAEYVRMGGEAPRRFYGNLGQIIAQSERDARVDVLIGDAAFLDQSKLEFARRVDLGVGRLALAWARGVRIERAEEAQSLARVAMPDPRQAIYGRAAEAFVQQSAWRFAHPPKLLSTVPQISAYLRSGEIDAGFINLTEALALGEAIGGYIELPRESYPAIRIQAAFPAAADDDSEDCARFLQGAGARAILSAHGL